jgi:hypothetical protein
VFSGHLTGSVSVHDAVVSLWRASDAWYIGLAVLVVILGRTFYYTVGRRLRDRFGTPLGEPEVNPGMEASGLVLLVLAVVGATLLAYACPFPRIE